MKPKPSWCCDNYSKRLKVIVFQSSAKENFLSEPVWGENREQFCEVLYGTKSRTLFFSSYLILLPARWWPKFKTEYWIKLRPSLTHTSYYVLRASTCRYTYEMVLPTKELQNIGLKRECIINSLENFRKENFLLNSAKFLYIFNFQARVIKKQIKNKNMNGSRHIQSCSGIYLSTKCKPGLFKR